MPLINMSLNYTANIILVCIQLCLLLFMLYVARIVFKFVGWNDKTMLSMIIMLNLEIMC